MKVVCVVLIVQSDWESASEVEDRGHLDHVSKENLYEAYHKIFNRYNRMKSKYKELVTNYRQLDREKDKAKVVNKFEKKLSLLLQQIYL